MSDVDEFRKALQASLDRNQDVFEKDNDNKRILEELYLLSKADIDAVVPQGSGSEPYANLISLLKEATKHNVAQAELVLQIQSLGENAISIAKLVAPLAALL